MKSIKANMPATVFVDDYYETTFLRDKLRGIIPGVKVKEAGFDWQKMQTSVLVYLGSLADRDNDKALKAEKNRLKNTEIKYKQGA